MKTVLRFMLLFSLVFTVLGCFGAEASPEAVPQTLAPWVQTVIGIVVALVGTFVLPYLHQAATAAKAEAALHQINTNASLLDQREVLLAQLKAFLLEQADMTAADRWPSLAADISAGKINGSAAVKAELYKWGDELKTNAIAHFKQNGIDIVALLGEKAIDDAISIAANKTSPFPGKEAAVEVLKNNIVPLLIQNGTNWLKKHYMNEGSTPVVEAVTLPSPANGAPATVVLKKVEDAA